MSQTFSSASESPATAFKGDLKPRKLSITGLICVILYTATLLFPTLGGWRVLTRHEVLAAEPAREMLHGGHFSNWIIPRFAGVPRMVKPPTTGWMIAGSMALFHSEAEWVARLPAALAAVATAALIASLAGRWLGNRTGLIAGLLQATFAYGLMQGRLAEADMPMCAAVCLAMIAFAMANVDGARRQQPSRWLPLVFYFGTALSLLIKGVGPIFILSGCASFTLILGLKSGNWRPLRFLLNPWGLALFVLLIVPWPLAAWRLDPEIVQVWRREVFGRAAGEFAERQPWFFYAIAVPALLLPWLPFTLVGLIEGFRRGWLRQPMALFVGCWFLPGLLILSLSAFKHHHYAIPMLPPATLIAAAGMMFWLGAGGKVQSANDVAPLSTEEASTLPRYSGGGQGGGPFCESATAVPVMAKSPHPNPLSEYRQSDKSAQDHRDIATGGFSVTGSASAGPSASDSTIGADRAADNTATFPDLVAGVSSVPRAFLVPGIWSAICAVIALIVALRIKQGGVPIAGALGLLMLGGATAIFAIQSARPRLTSCAVFATAWIVAVYVGLFVFPAFDEYKWSTQLARRANLVVPAGEPVCIMHLGEYQAAYYLRLPVTRVDQMGQIPAWLAAGPRISRYAICPASVARNLQAAADVVELDRVEHLRRGETEADRPVLVRVTPRLPRGQ